MKKGSAIVDGAGQVTAVILGASRGLGRELATLCSAAGWKTVQISSSCEDKVTRDIRYVKCDLASNQDSTKCVDLIDTFGSVDRFYWVAGKMLRGNIVDANVDEIERTVDINFRNPLRIVRSALLRQLAARRTTKFVAVASSAAENPKAGEAVYAATKSAQATFVRSVAMEMAHSRVQTILALPGGMQTSLWDSYPNSDYSQFSDPTRVAERIFEFSENATTAFSELSIPRGFV